ncbi:ABC transporter ATP-binding protein [Aquabacterium sp. CECT 9606]|uniref:ABC transporter ATP-binding protein n=1 Tax=Aquabacterium sp. CECT 9606 TaxID=2845822 RepID=UPI001E4C271D|nr:ABC transporter ATP-binding protein [Aquabacterium sp. CECT 9606]CAH0353690.1 Aliphatic sulfonates import ATP-binding protein SsuB [Aquabacterium sp. CECT 9606]
MHSAIEVQGATQIYPNGTQALLPVSLSVAEGEFVTLLGPSGCGKSTLLRMVAGLLLPTHGGVVVQGKRLSFVFQEATLMPWASVQANVRLPLDLAHVPRPQADARVARALSQVGLQGSAGQRPRELSGGMQMRVSIARSLVTEPQILLMDEPFGALDEITRQGLDDELLKLWHAQGLSVVFVTHSISEAVYLSQRVVVMAAHPGRIVDEISIGAPYPRGDDWRASPAFHTLERHLRQCLSDASKAAA